VGHPTRGVRAEPAGRGDRHAGIPFEGPCQHAAVENPPGAGSLNEGEATMQLSPHMVPEGPRPAVARQSEDVRAVREACLRGAGAPALEQLPGGYSFRDGWAGYRRVSKGLGGRCGGIGFPATAFACGSGAGGG
jgi:hypothetical protein